MGRRRKADEEEVQDEISTPIADLEMDPFLAEQMSVLHKMSDGGIQGQLSTHAESAMLCLPFRPFSLRWLFSNSGFVVGRMTELVGLTESCKTGLLFEIYRWHLELGGYYKHLLCEPRDSPDLRRSIVGEKYKSKEVVIPCSYLESWQKAATATLKTYEKNFPRSPLGTSDAYHLVCDGVDSMTSVTTEKAATEIYENGCASPGFSPIARAITDWSRVYFNKMSPYPVSFVGINHIKDKPNSQGLPTKTIPGGAHLGYAATTILNLRCADKFDRHGFSGREIEIKTIKNSLSTAGEARSLKVEMVWKTDEEGRQTTHWDWDRATILLLKSFAPSSAVRKKIDEIVNIEGHNLTTSRASCKALGLKNAPFSEIGKAIGESEEITSALDSLFRVRRRHEWRPGVPYSQQLREAVANPLYQPAGDLETVPVDLTDDKPVSYGGG